MFLTHDSGDASAVGTPDGSVEPDADGVFEVPNATGHALLKMGGWTEVGPEATTAGKAAIAEAEAKAAEEAAAAQAEAEAAAAAEAKAAKAAATKAAKAAAADDTK
ncbi:hypothetical protein SEA_SONALI_8 [Arthrobacter phage Sonali]|uniref:Uncharacterized protein n=1 Tax=Arthrobacter phage Sonali TaxID=2510495 RepID=A0A411CQC1_9CAUD|nr:hypothetical protein HOV09_gp08 [Arthrobacter phage Sonali]QAY16121.1 hypothetical protein SEA_SONALI_8 [Arthrobacter phage Sonali]